MMGVPVCNSTFLVVLQSLFLLLLCGCGGTFPPVGTITRIEIRGPMERRYGTITSVPKIERFVAFINSERGGWGAWFGFNDLFGPPVPDVIADLYYGDILVGSFCEGPGYLETSLYSTGWVSKLCSEQTSRQFFQLLGICPPQLGHN
jgi:hypothetical protein